jgi:hypothetical protein
MVLLDLHMQNCTGSNTDLMFNPMPYLSKITMLYVALAANKATTEGLLHTINDMAFQVVPQMAQ